MKGIYSILCIATGQRYIGQAVNIKRRLGEHRRKLEKGRHPNYKIQALWDKYGQDLFTFCVLEDLPKICSKEWLTVREQFWIDHFSPLVLNISLDADSYRYLIEKKLKHTKYGKQKQHI
jgi:group I intron endonuclease